MAVRPADNIAAIGRAVATRRGGRVVRLPPAAASFIDCSHVKRLRAARHGFPAFGAIVSTDSACHEKNDWRVCKTSPPPTTKKNMTISSLGRLCSMLRAAFPAIDSGKDLALVLEIGRGQEAGCELTQKQLCLCGIASAATIRRRLRNLVAKKVVRRNNNRHDGRSVTFALTEASARQLKQVSRAARQMEW